MENYLPEYFAMLWEANAAADKVDDFDLNEKRTKEFNDLLQDQYECSRILIEYIAENSFEILEQLKALAKPL